MAIYRRIFVVEDVARIHRLFAETLDAALLEDRALKDAGLVPVNVVLIRDLQRAWFDYRAGLETVAVRTAISARARIAEAIKRSQKRPDTGIQPHLAERIVCRALPPIAGFPTGAVGVADEAVLDRQGGWYWRVQEYGTGSAEIQSIIGNELRGYFYQRGWSSPSAPDPGEFRHHALFAPGPPIGGMVPGLRFGRGIVRQEIPGRHFLETGAQQAFAQYQGMMHTLEQQTVGAVSRAMAAGARARLP